MSDVIKRDDARGLVSWTPKPGDTFLVVGKTVTGQRFRKEFKRWFDAECINLYQGSRYLVRDGKRHLIERTWN